MKKVYQSPNILDHQKIKFETAISSTGHWEFQFIEGCWVRVFVQA